MNKPQDARSDYIYEQIQAGRKKADLAREFGCSATNIARLYMQTVGRKALQATKASSHKDDLVRIGLSHHSRICLQRRGIETISAARMWVRKPYPIEGVGAVSHHEISTKLAEWDANQGYEQVTVSPERSLRDKIECLDLTVRVFNSLRRTGMTTVGDVITWLHTPVRPKIRNLGEDSLQELLRKLEPYLLDSSLSRELTSSEQLMLKAQQIELLEKDSIYAEILRNVAKSPEAFPHEEYIVKADLYITALNELRQLWLGGSRK